ncbi:MAG: GAF domain-containing protein [Pseudomonadota bacterium]
MSDDITIRRPSTTNQQILSTLDKLTDSVDALTFPEKAREIIRVGTQHFGFPIGALSYQDGDKLHVLFAESPDNTLPEGTAIDICNTFCEETMRSGETHVVADASKVERWHNHPARVELGIESYLGTPIRLQGKIWGTLCFFDSRVKQGRATESDRQLIELMASQIQNNYEHALARDLFSAALVGTTGASQSTLLANMVEQLAGVLKADMVWISQCTGVENENARALAVWENQELGESFEYPIANTPCQYVAMHGFTHWHGDLQEHFPEPDLDEAERFHSYVGVPIADPNGGLIGLLSVANRERLDINEYTRGLMEIYASRAAAELEVFRAGEFSQGTRPPHPTSDKLSGLGLMAAGIAHDLNNLFTGIMGNILLLQEKAKTSDAEMFELTKNLLQGTERAAMISRGMLTYLSDNNESKSLVNLNELVKKIPSILESTLPSGVVLHQRLDLIPDISADKGQINQAVINLITNAAEACSNENGNIMVHTRTVTINRKDFSDYNVRANLREGTYIAIEVSDDGIGLDDERLKRMFEPFFSSKSQGRGLGLATTKRIVIDHAGAIKVRSQPGDGTTVTLIFPQSSSTNETAAGSTSNPKNHARPRLLVVDDEVTVREIVVGLLADQDIDVVTTSTAEQALEMIGQESFNSVLIDIVMPGMDGVEAAKEISRMRGDTNVVLMSGHHKSDLLNRFEGTDDFTILQKPLDLGDLRDTVLN